MRSPSTTRLARNAAIRLTISVALVLVASGLVLRSTGGSRGPEAPEPFYTELPGVDLSGLTQARKQTVLKRLNVQRCPCDCNRTVASCRVHHGCSMSLAAAQEALR
jgi:hypothetical protein